MKQTPKYFALLRRLLTAAAAEPIIKAEGPRVIRAGRVLSNGSGR